MAARVMGLFPSRIGDGSFPYLDDAVAWCEADFCGGANDLDVCPLIAMPVDIVGNFAEQDAFLPQYTKGFVQERFERVRQIVAAFDRRLHDKAESILKVFRLIAALVGNVGRIIDYHVERLVVAGHIRVVSQNIRRVRRINIHADYLAVAAAPKTPCIYRCIQDVARGFLWIKAEHLFQQLRIIAVPHGRQRLVGRRRRLIGLEKHSIAATGRSLFRHGLLSIKGHWLHDRAITGCCRDARLIRVRSSVLLAA